MPPGDWSEKVYYHWVPEVGAGVWGESCASHSLVCCPHWEREERKWGRGLP